MRQQILRSPILLLGFTVLLAACTGTITSSTAGPLVDIETSSEFPTDAEVVAEADAVSASRPDWQRVELTDVRTGETFTLSDFDDQVIIMEAMAVWCPLCDQQQIQIKSALSELGDGVIGVSLDVDPSETADIVVRHADDLDLPWRFVVAGRELSAMLQREFGPQVLTPPSTPVLIIAPNGITTLTPFGIKGWDELVDYARPLIP
jgi:thiol-disulfide isomerase/thioredoxin